MSLKWHEVERSEHGPAGWYAEIAPGVELVRVPWTRAIEHLYIRLDGCTLPLLHAELHIALRDEQLRRLIAGLQRVGLAGERLAAVQLPEPPEPAPQTDLFGDAP